MNEAYGEYDCRSFVTMRLVGFEASVRTTFFNSFHVIIKNRLKIIFLVFTAGLDIHAATK